MNVGDRVTYTSNAGTFMACRYPATIEAVHENGDVTVRFMTPAGNVVVRPVKPATITPDLPGGSVIEEWL